MAGGFQNHWRVNHQVNCKRICIGKVQQPGSSSGARGVAAAAAARGGSQALDASFGAARHARPKADLQCAASGCTSRRKLRVGARSSHTAEALGAAMPGAAINPCRASHRHTVVGHPAADVVGGFVCVPVGDGIALRQQPHLCSSGMGSGAPGAQRGGWGLRRRRQGRRQGRQMPTPRRIRLPGTCFSAASHAVQPRGPNPALRPGSSSRHSLAPRPGPPNARSVCVEPCAATLGAASPASSASRSHALSMAAALNAQAAQPSLEPKRV